MLWGADSLETVKVFSHSCSLSHSSLFDYVIQRESVREFFWWALFLLMRWNTDVLLRLCVCYETNTPAPTDGDSLRWINGWSNHKQLRNTTLYFRFKTAATPLHNNSNKRKAEKRCIKKNKKTIKVRQTQRTNLTVVFPITGCAVMTTKTEEYKSFCSVLFSQYFLTELSHYL